MNPTLKTALWIAGAFFVGTVIGVVVKAYTTPNGGAQ